MKRSLAISFAFTGTITILAMGQPLHAQNPRTIQAPNRKVLTTPTLPAPCCSITAINTSTGVVTANVSANGNIFQFKVTNAALLNSLKVGQGVYANFTTNQVSLDGTTACCAITTSPAPPPPAPPAGGAPPPAANQPAAGPAATSSAATSSPAMSSATKSVAAPMAVGAIGSKLAPPPPCCSITAIDTNAGVVFAKVNANDDIFEFKVTDATLLKSLKTGQGVYANFTTMQVSLDGNTACCPIIKPPAPQPTKPSTSTGSSGATTQLGGKTLAGPRAVTIPPGIALGSASPANAAQAPTFGPVGGAYYAQDFQTGVTIADATTGAVIYYTTDGSTPTTSSTRYSGPIPVRSTTTIKAMATASGMTNSTIASATYTMLQPPPPTCPAGSVLEGVDVSESSGTIDWKKVRASGRTFAYARAGVGASYVDKTFSQNYAAIKAAGLVRGAYHTFDATADGTRQADSFLSTIGTVQPGDLPPALDVSSQDSLYGNQGPVPVSTVQARISEWMSRVQAVTGRIPIVYSAAPLLLQALGSATSVDLLWIANYGVTCPTLPTGAQKWVFWQYSGMNAPGSGTPTSPAPTGIPSLTPPSASAPAPTTNQTTMVPGIPGAADLNRFNGTLADLKSLAKSSTSHGQSSSVTGQSPADIQPLEPLSPATTAPAPTANQPTTNQASTSSAASAATAASGQTQSKVASAGLAAAPPLPGVSLPPVGGPAAQPGGTAKPLAAAAPASVIQNVRQFGALPQLSYGTPQPAPSGPRGMPARWESHGTYMHIHGYDGIEQAQGIPEGVKTLLKIHVMALEPGQSDHYLVNPQLALEWSKTHPVRAEIKPPSTSDGHSGCSAWSMHCAGEVVKHAEAETSRQAQILRQEAQADWRHWGTELTKDWHEAEGCLADNTLALDNIPIEFAASPSVGIHLEKSGKVVNGSVFRSVFGDTSHGSASGMAEGTVNLALPMKSPDFQANLEVFYIPCLPFMVRPKSISGRGTLTVGSRLTAAVKATGQFDQNLSTGGAELPIVLIPIVLFGVPIAELQVSAYAEGNIEVSGQGAFTANFALDNPHEMKLNFSCDGHGCTGRSQPVAVPTIATETAQLNGRIRVEPTVFTAVELDFDFGALTARAGPQPYLLGEVYGCVGAAASQDLSNGSSTAQDWHALTADVDWGVDLRGQVLTGGEKVFDETLHGVIKKNTHIWFKDLWPGGSNALYPFVDGAAQAPVGAPALYQIKMPSCYPYQDKMKYQLAWTGGATASLGASATTAASGDSGATLATRGVVQQGARLNVGGNGAPSPSTNAQDPCNLQSGQGYCEFDPVKNLSLDLVWPAAGNYNLTVTAVGDTPHGRAYNSAQPTTMNVTVGSSGSGTSTSTSNGGTPSAPPSGSGTATPTSNSGTTTSAPNGSTPSASSPPIRPCCQITAVDPKSGVATARVMSTGTTFQFKVTDRATLLNLQLGQGVFANLPAKRVSLNGTGSCCVIVSVTPAPASGTGVPIRAGDLLAPSVSPQTADGIRLDPNPNHLPDLVLDFAPVMLECTIKPGHTCQDTCSSITIPTNFGVHNLTQYPANGPIKLILTELASGAVVQNWTVNGVDANQWAFSGGFFTYWKCPTGDSIDSHPDNYKLEIQGPPELTSNGKSQQIYIPPDAVFCSGNPGLSGCKQ
ncbi:MAG TPA: GH25 family lysozyme [Terriglobales bacterium]|nr:GH25 family lysozyme [Terriglobales bacterium]